jgi:hypothetical protein
VPPTAAVNDAVVSDQLRVATRDLRAVVDRLFAELERRHGEDIDLGADFYWNLDLSNSYDFTTVEREVDVGSLADDVGSLMAAAELLDGEPMSLWHDLEHLVGVLRRVAYLECEGRSRARPAPTVWIFHGERARFASGVFPNAAAALEWVAQHRLTGVITEYPVGVGAYDAAVREDRFRTSREHHGTPDHIAGFSPGLGHIHVSDGCRA